MKARLAHAISHDAERTGVPARHVVARDGLWLAETTGVAGSSRLKSLVGANGLLCMSRARAGLPAGEVVSCILMDQPENAEAPW